jgi:hypothetical protein
MSDAERHRRRTAVVVIHGMGEQLPMDTLRRFVESAVPFDAARDRTPVFNKPDVSSKKTDLRRLILPSSRHRPVTDFYEYYWAPEFDAGRLSAFLSWATRRLLFGRFAGPTRVLVRWLRGISLVIAVLVVSYFVFRDRIEAAWWFGVASIIAATLWVGISYVIQHFLTDVSRYIAPTSRDIEARNSIRLGAMDLIRRLHADGRYTRIVVVGHSLGSVIGYDVLRLTWEEFRKPVGVPAELISQPVMRGFDDEARVLLEETRRRDGSRRSSEFQELQTRLARENRAVGIPWLVTDFITLGSPLAHAAALFDAKRYDLQYRIAQQEFPVCPPVRSEVAEDGAPPRSAFARHLPGGGEQLLPSVGAVFGPTRWTNLYFPTNTMLAGDPAGGPLQDVFGYGIKDVPVRLSFDAKKAQRIRRVPFYSHTQYWSGDPAVFDHPADALKSIDEQTGTRDAVSALRAHLRL